MKKTVLTFGLISGAIAAAMMLATLPFAEKIGEGKALILGYTTIVLSALLIFFGVRSYRENVSGGRLTFGRAVAVGILIAFISSLCYVATWEIISFKFMPDFADKYAARMIERAKASGATQQQIDQKVQEAKQFKEMYKNPVYNVTMTFLEPFPIGLAVTLLSAAVLRRKSASAAA
jgi:Na+/melibiose symporter-like transporter